MFNKMRGLASKAGLGLTDASAGLIGAGGWKTAAGEAGMLGARGLGYMRGMSNTGLSAAMGGVAGGTYGAFSNDTSVIGGALGGMALGAGALGATRLGQRGAGVYRGMGPKGMGLGRGQAAGMAAHAMAGTASRFIGQSYAQASNGFNALARAGANKAWGRI